MRSCKIYKNIKNYQFTIKLKFLMVKLNFFDHMTMNDHRFCKPGTSTLNVFHL